MQENNVFRLNHLGFPKNSYKGFTYVGKDNSGKFSLLIMKNGGLTEVFSGTMEFREKSEVSDACFVGDFSSICEEGVYRLKVSDQVSRIFYIDDNVYDSLSRMITEFFVWQRCGDKKGWNGLCHMDDKLVDKFGDVHYLNGGHHQSGDLRKWAFGVPRGIFGLSEYLKLGNPLWNDGEIEYDIAHSVKYFLNRQSREGYIFDCSFVPFDYDAKKSHGKGFEDYSSFHKAFRYYDRACDQLGLWNTLMMFISASTSLKDYDESLANRSREGALKLWDYMQSTGRYTSDFDWIDYPPIGHDGFKQTFFDLFYEDSLPNLVYEVYCAIGLYKLVRDESIKNRAFESLKKLSDLMVCDKDGAMKYFKQSSLSDKPSKLFSSNAPLAFAFALETFDDNEQTVLWKKVCEGVLKGYEKQIKENAYQIVSNDPDGFYSYLFITDHSYTVIFLSKLAKFFGKERTLPLAQRLIDFIVGFNPADISAVEGVGYNQAQHALFGEYFPSQPQIPGGVFTDFNTKRNSFDNYGVEYDLPLAGEYLYAVNEYLKALEI